MKSWRMCQQPEGSSSEVWGLNPKLGSPACSTRAKKGTQIIPSVKSSRMSVHQEEMATCRELLKGPMRKIPLAVTYPGLWRRGMKSGLEPHEILRRVALGTGMKEKLPGSLC